MSTPSAESVSKPEKVVFSFEGRPLEGLAREPLALALFRAGIRTLSYSIKYHYPRGIRCGRGRCRQCDLEVNGIPGVPACITPLEAGMVVRREDYRPFYAPFFSIIMRRLKLPAGFYYRMLTKPILINKLFESNLRRMAGVGRLELSHSPAGSQASSPATCTIHSINSRYDVVVVGGGVAGLAASLAAAGEGSRILLVDENAQLGGFDLGHPADPDSFARLERLRREAESVESITIACGVTAQGFYPPDTLLVHASRPAPGAGGTMKRIRAGAFVFATGAYDSLPPFENNHLPGIFGPRAVRLLLERDDYPLGDKAVVYGSGSLLGDTAAFLEARGVRSVSTVDAGTGFELTAAGGRQWVEAARFRSPDSGKTTALRCDLLCIALPGLGCYELPQQAGFQYMLGGAGPEKQDRLLPLELRLEPEGGAACFLAGEITGEVDQHRIIEQGRQAGALAATASAKDGPSGHRPDPGDQ
jgi:sarcosine oxidase subunit alpha